MAMVKRLEICILYPPLFYIDMIQRTEEKCKSWGSNDKFSTAIAAYFFGKSAA
ncbi:hypothetical protein HMPREF7545_0281 [Selenomonas noxia ATCC 43541]|nr:hypothetical protein HMPREF7545_0281 [Selenomonas noxia ATCC 43541]